MMSDETADLFIAHEESKELYERAFDDFCEQRAAELEITVDYYLAEFV